MILEDMLGRDEPKITDLKHMRDFVSHGDPLTNPALLALVESELGYRSDRYEPGNASHVGMIRKYRGLARAMVDYELMKLVA